MVSYCLYVKRMKPIVLQNSLYFTRFNVDPHRNSVYICTCAWLHSAQYFASTKLWSLVLYILFCVSISKCVSASTCMTSLLYDDNSSNISIEEIIHKIRAEINPIYNGYRHFENKIRRKKPQQFQQKIK